MFARLYGSRRQWLVLGCHHSNWMIGPWIHRHNHPHHPPLWCLKRGTYRHCYLSHRTLRTCRELCWQLQIRQIGSTRSQCAEALTVSAPQMIRSGQNCSGCSTVHLTNRMSLSASGGTTWSVAVSPIQEAAGQPKCVVGAEECAWGSAQQIWDPVRKRAILQFDLAAKVHSGGCDGSSNLHGTYQVVSTDRGATFGEFQDLQARYLSNLSACMCPTSGNGAFLPKRGRILATTVHSAYKGDVVLISDDGGRTYNYSTDLLVPGVDEGQLAVLPNGSVINLMRNCWHGSVAQCAQSAVLPSEFPSNSNLLSYSISTSGKCNPTWDCYRTPSRLYDRFMET